MKAGEPLAQLRAQANPANAAGMARFGIRGAEVLGISIPVLRKLAKEAGRDHALAQQLWASGVHEARILAGMVADPAQMTEAAAEEWVAAFDSWDLCDQVCMNLLRHCPFAYAKSAEWSGREEELVKRAGFALMAALAQGDKQAGDDAFASFLPVIEREAGDDRPMVRKAVNWALRQIGKRDLALNKQAVKAAERVRGQGSRSARWIAGDALRELRSEAVQGRLRQARPRPASRAG